MVFDLMFFALFLLALTAAGMALGPYMAGVFSGRIRFLALIERPLLRIAGTDGTGQRWPVYAASVLAFNAAGFVLLYLVLRVQGWLPLNPQGFGAMAPDQAFNTAVSFMTNTNWQSYGGETTLSHFTQMFGLTVQNFVSAATGIAVAVAVVRGLAARSGRDLGNFWNATASGRERDPLHHRHCGDTLMQSGRRGFWLCDCDGDSWYRKGCIDGWRLLAGFAAAFATDVCHRRLVASSTTLSAVASLGHGTLHT